MKVVRREASPLILQLVVGRAFRLSVRVHANVIWQPVGFFQITRAAGRNDIVPAGCAAAGARNEMIECEIIARSAIHAGKPVSQEHIKTCKRRRPVLFYDCLLYTSPSPRDA